MAGHVVVIAISNGSPLPEHFESLCKMPSSFLVFHHSFLPPNSISLGRLVIDAHAPWQDFCTPSIALNRDDIAILPQPRVRELLERSKGTSLCKSLNYLFDPLGRDGSPNLLSHEKTYLLLNSGDYFRRACADNSIREWLETVVKHGWNAYMVVGIHTVHESSINGLQSARFFDSATTGVPGQQELEAGLTLMTECVEPKLNDIGPGELVIAAQYRKVQFKWFCKDKIESAFLEVGSNRWKVFAMGGRSGSSGDGDEVIEADFQETITENDVKEEGKIHRIGDEIIII